MRSAIIGEPHWFLGAAGDAAIAIGVALRAQRCKGNTLVTVDLAMTAVPREIDVGLSKLAGRPHPLLLAALEGNVAAALLMSSTLKRRSEIDPRCKMLSDSWLTYKAVTVAPQPRPRALLRSGSGPPQGAESERTAMMHSSEFCIARPRRRPAEQ